MFASRITIQRYLRLRFVGRVLIGLGGAWALSLNAQETLTLGQTLQRVIDEYAPLQTSALRVERAHQQSAIVESQLGWNLNSSVGLSHDVSFLGVPADRTEANAGVQRQLASGGSVGVSGGYVYEDSALSLIPSLPNPSTSTNLDLNYRLPLGRGLGNPQYKQGLVSAEAEFVLAESNHHDLRDRVAQQTIDLFYAATLTQARIRNAEEAIGRARRLLGFVKDNKELGLAEEKDLLQAEAQLRGQQAQLHNLEVAWRQQRTDLNRLIMRTWNENYALAAGALPADELVPPLPEVVEQAYDHSPVLRNTRARLDIAEATLARKRDQRKDKVDVVLSVGNRTRSGDTISGDSIDESDRVGGISIEYTRALDRQGVDAEVYQAQLDKSIALQEIKTEEDNLRYRVSGLVADIEATREALEAYRRQLSIDREKMADAIERYRSGRADTRQLIDFENDLNTTLLAVRQQAIELERKRATLALLRGTLWAQLSIDTHRERRTAP